MLVCAYLQMQSLPLSPLLYIHPVVGFVPWKAVSDCLQLTNKGNCRHTHIQDAVLSPLNSVKHQKGISSSMS